MNWNSIPATLQKILQQNVVYLQNLCWTLVILFVGWIVASILQSIMVRVLKFVRLDIASEKTGLSNLLAKGEIHRTPAQLISDLIYWFLMLGVFIVAISALGVEVSSVLFNSILLYVPKVIAAIFVLILGMFVASIISGIVLLTASNTGLSNAKLFSKVTQFAIIIFSVIVALDQLGIATAILSSAFAIIIGALGLAFAIAFGLGCKEIAASFMMDVLKLTRNDKK